MSKANSEEEKILKRIPLEVILLSSVLALGTIFLFDFLTGLLFFGGGLLSATGFFWLSRSLSNILGPEKKRSLKKGLFLYIARLLLILAIFFIIILFASRKILAFAAGFSLVILVFLGEALLALAKLGRWKI